MNGINETTPAVELLPAEVKYPAQINSHIEEQLKYTSLYLPAAAPDKNNIWNTPIINIVNIMKRSGISPDHLKTALLALFNLNSAHLGNPFALELIDESYAGADKIIRICSELTPNEFLINFSHKVTLENLQAEKYQIKGRTIVGFDSMEFEKVKKQINQFLNNQKLIDDIILPSRRGAVPLKIELTGPTGCVLITDNRKKIILEYPSFLKCFLQSSSNPGIYVSDLSPQESARLKYDSRLLTASLERLNCQPIKIPYSGQLINFLQKKRVAQDKIETLLRILRIVTIINHSPPLNGIEFLSTFAKSDSTEVALAFGHTVAPLSGLIAKKVDYYVFWKLVSGFIQSEDTFLSDRQKKIFNVVKNLSLNKLASSTCVNPQASKYEKLSAIKADNSPCWSTIDQILIEINSDSGEEISSATLYKDMQELIKVGFIGEGKYSGINKKGYYVTATEIVDTIELPHPSDIDDHMFNGKIKIVNPLTGEGEEV